MWVPIASNDICVPPPVKRHCAGERAGSARGLCEKLVARLSYVVLVWSVRIGRTGLSAVIHFALCRPNDYGSKGVSPVRARTPRTCGWARWRGSRRDGAATPVQTPWRGPRRVQPSGTDHATVGSGVCRHTGRGVAGLSTSRLTVVAKEELQTPKTWKISLHRRYTVV